MIKRSPEFEAFIEPARAKPQIWRILLGLALVAASWMGTSLLAFGSFMALYPDTNPMDLAKGQTRGFMIILLFSFSGLALGSVVAARALHKRGLASLIGPLGPAWRHFGIAAGVFIGLQVIVYVLFFPSMALSVQHTLLSVLMFLPIAAVLVLLQTGAEELFFRGYLLQQLAARSRSPLIWFLLPPVLFGVLHYNPAMAGDRAWIVVAIITITGIAWTDLTRATGNIGAAAGWHFANNFMLMNFFAVEGELSGFAWQLLPFSIKDVPLAYLLMDGAAALVIWGILRWLLRKEGIRLSTKV